MQQLLNTNLYLGSKYDLEQTNNSDWAFVHACKTSHVDRLGKQSSDSPYYIMFEEENHLYINWVDAPSPKMFDWQGKGVINFIKVLDFIDSQIKDKKVFVHCDQGQSRSPAVAMLYMSKRMKKIPQDFELSKIEFAKLYPDYFSGSGITKFIEQNWDLIT
jgi:protein tyrosine phosphatase